MDKLIIFGFGGHARSVGNVALSQGFRHLIFVENTARSGENFLGHRVVPSLEEVDASWVFAHAASGDGLKRKAQCEQIVDSGLILLAVVSPSSSIGVGSVIGEGSFVGDMCHIGPMAQIGTGCILNTGCVVEHECIVGDFTHVSVNSTVAGRSRVGRLSMLGAGSVVIDGVSISDRITVGAGSVVTRDIVEPGTYVGAPVKKIRSHSKG
ncbi:MAG: NeuD/PglB/VioB family sugar acetyltransferase [Acidovorax sp.]|nr:NeuD/PglB/VioB family sugar acetyltransferase [Acidovorax sp.]MCE1191513.1 NeuD/PglB/VioB family sugar acetyltransferase [Acidovorax sp.]